MFEEHFDFTWRVLRRLGAPDADDAAQQVWIIVARKLDSIPRENERAFIFATAQRVASVARRTLNRRREVSADAVEELLDPKPSAEESLEDRGAREFLDEVLAAMSFDLRVVFVLFELEQLSTVQIAEILGLPVGTATSRLRRAREQFHAIVKRRRAGATGAGGVR